MMEKLLILDGNSLLHRAFHALPLLSTTTGQFTNAVYGFMNMLQKLVRDEKPDYLAVAFDRGKVTFRHQKYEDYKANRKATPDELRPQFPLIKKILRALRIPVLELDGFEGDDLIGAVVRAAEKKGLDVVIVTGDRDLLQLVSEHTRALITRKGISDLECFTPDVVKKKYGVDPAQIPDLKGLKGDKSDNIPGVPGIGQKTAVQLLTQFKSVEECLANMDDLPSRAANSLQEYTDQALLSKTLATLATDVPIEIDFSDFKVEQPDYEALISIYQELEFKSLLKNLQDELPQSVIDSFCPAESECLIVSTVSGLVSLLAELKEVSEFALCFDRDGDSVSPHHAPLTRLGFAWGEESYATVIFSAQPESREKMLALVSELFSDSECKKLCHDAKAEIIMCRRYGLDLQGIIGDTMLAAYLLNSSVTDPKLDEITLKYRNQVVTFDENEQGVAQRALAVWQLWPILRENLNNDELDALFYDLELPLSGVLAQMELTGVKLDIKQLEEMSGELEKQLTALTEEIYALAGEEFNINSPKQLGHILFEKLNLPVIKRTKTGYSTDAEVLEKLVPHHDIAKHLLAYRQLTKLKSTYIDGLRNLVDKESNKVYTTFNQTSTATGRLSSTEPNLQNIPIKMELGRKIREAFVPSEPGWLILTADYSQIELRVLAHMSRDERLIADFLHGEDIHTRTAATIFGVEQDDVTPDLRRRAKGINYGIIYGITDYGLARDVGVSREEAALYIANYFRNYAGVKRFIDETIATARERGYVLTLLKRRRYLPDLLSSNRNVRSFGERTAINTPIQGSAADIIKLAMLKIDKELRGNDLQARMLLQVHDELVFELPSEEAEILIPLVRTGMENVIKLIVPLEVDIEIGPNWYDLEKVERYHA